ncbi:MAG TPA: hypothetical protein VM076_12380 [Gemmatimonadaceae bacterium]|nr:hypothetical protein [Gemmatimonadaceae bacterium]
MTPYFPRQTAEWPKFEEPAAFRRFSMSIWEMALVTGVLVRLYRALAMTTGPTNSWLYFGTTLALGLLVVLGMATLHLGNYPLKHWLWRAPLFGALEAAAEALTSLGLILAHREPNGSERAHLHEWPGIAAGTFFWRFAIVVLFALVLAGIVQLVRYLLLRRDHRVHTAIAVHEESAKHP